MLQSSVEHDPWDALGLFVEELTNENIDTIRGHTQEAQFFFFAIAGQELFDSNGIEFFSFMMPTIQTVVSFEQCLQCQFPGNCYSCFNH